MDILLYTYSLQLSSFQIATLPQTRFDHSDWEDIVIVEVFLIVLLQQWFSTISPLYHLIRICPHFKTPQRPENSSYLGLGMERCTH